MNEVFGFRLPEYEIVRVAVSGIFLFLLLRLLRRWIARLQSLQLPVGSGMLRLRKYFTANVSRFTPLAETIIWFIYLIWALHVIFVNPAHYTLALLVLAVLILVWIFWFAMRDLVAGLILKTREAYRRNQIMHFGELSGKVTNVGILSLQIEKGDGERVTIPFSRLTGEIQGRSVPNTFADFHRFSFRMDKTEDVGRTISRIGECLLSAPWTSLVREPVVRLKSETDSEWEFEISVYLLGSQFIPRIEAYLNNRLNSDKQSDGKSV